MGIVSMIVLFFVIVAAVTLGNMAAHKLIEKQQEKKMKEQLTESFLNQFLQQPKPSTS